ncbi:immunoglobulin alpha-2 heavy chain-like [Melozone crissalis]|uniref:immunoglobulin alpha-2 heavy chain-like n=1 Tax=Melozone crissalis TaxID=40204 RepID=UPI0023DBAB84|nr:immunoglobulin alpha-2 heavy chain-like [Melozone crissalis]XP_054146073.1 immunoglobulin alpha-2 heavy chain-like [Melozone crissalis]
MSNSNRSTSIDRFPTEIDGGIFDFEVVHSQHHRALPVVPGDPEPARDRCNTGGTIYYAPSVQSRFKISRDNGQSSVTLTTNNHKDEDSATYICAKSWDGCCGPAAGKFIDSDCGGDLQPPGGSLRLLCLGSGFDFGNYGMYWIRQRPGQALEFVAGINADGVNTFYAPSVKGRFRISRDNGQSSVTLTMNNLKDEDSRSYFCAKRISGGNAGTAGAFGPVLITVSSAGSGQP